MNELKEKFAQLAMREKVLVAVAAFAVLFLLVYMLVWQPMVEKQNRLDRQWNKANADMTWIMENGAALQSLKGGSGKSSSRGNLSSILNQAAVSTGLAMKRFQPKGQNEAQVWFEQVSYNKLLDWFKTVEQDKGLTLRKVNITESGENNVVDVSVVVKQG